MADDDEDRIRRKAHELWMAEGQPEGRAERHWVEAREIIAMQDSFGTTLRSVEETTGETVEPILAVQNQGELPELRDQGQDETGPSWEAARRTTETQSLTVEDAPKRKRRSAAAGDAEKPAPAKKAAAPKQSKARAQS